MHPEPPTEACLVGSFISSPQVCDSKTIRIFILFYVVVYNLHAVRHLSQEDVLDKWAGSLLAYLDLLDRNPSSGFEPFYEGWTINNIVQARLYDVQSTVFKD
jgi:hypothetical protein